MANCKISSQESSKITSFFISKVLEDFLYDLIYNKRIRGFDTAFLIDTYKINVGFNVSQSRNELFVRNDRYKLQV